MRALIVAGVTVAGWAVTRQDPWAYLAGPAAIVAVLCWARITGRLS